MNLFSGPRLRLSLLACLSAGSIGIAHADLAETKGGVSIKSEDGRFEARFGGRIHLDGNVFIDDQDDADGIGDQATDLFFRRARLILEGKAYGWTYKFENDFAAQDDSEGSGFRELWIGTRLGSANLRVGQAKPYRGMEELTSSNEISFMERPFASSNVIYGNRQFLTGVFLDGAGSHWGWGLSGYNLRNGADSEDETDGVGASGRAYWAPLISESQVLHIGASASLDNPANGKAVAASGARYAGRSGPSASLGLSTVDEQASYGLEFAGKAGPVYAQVEYALASFGQDAASDLDLRTGYVQVSWMLTGETRPYDVKKGVFKSPKLRAESGAWELKLRYDYVETDGAATEREVTQASAGLNWYLNPSVRMMFEYSHGENEPEGGDSISGDVLTTRLQFAF